MLRLKKFLAPIQYLSPSNIHVFWKNWDTLLKCLLNVKFPGFLKNTTSLALIGCLFFCSLDLQCGKLKKY